VIQKLHCIVHFSAVLALSLATVPVALAQSSVQAVTTAAVRGNISSPAGALSAGANIASTSAAATAAVGAASNNASTVVVDDNDLEALFDDPKELARELSALSGPSVGPDGGQIYLLASQ
jgi:hypothetical protein